jgi:hypothetical protein
MGSALNDNVVDSCSQNAKVRNRIPQRATLILNRPIDSEPAVAKGFHVFYSTLPWEFVLGFFPNPQLLQVVAIPSTPSKVCFLPL